MGILKIISRNVLTYANYTDNLYVYTGTDFIYIKSVYMICGINTSDNSTINIYIVFYYN